MLADVETLIAGVHHKGVVHQAVAFEVVEHASHVVVEALHHLHIVAHIAVEFPFSQFAPLQIAAVEIFDDGVVEAVPSGALLLVHTAYEVMIGVFEAAVFVGAVHLEVVDDVHVLEDAHLLRGSGRASGIVVVERGRHRECAVLKQL